MSYYNLPTDTDKLVVDGGGFLICYPVCQLNTRQQQTSAWFFADNLFGGTSREIEGKLCEQLLATGLIVPLLGDEEYRIQTALGTVDCRVYKLMSAQTRKTGGNPMTLAEYKVQLALNTIDFRVAAKETKSSTVLQDIIGKTEDLSALYAVAMNAKSNIYTLTLLATFPDADSGVIIACAYHPTINLHTLLQWMKYPSISCVPAVQWRIRALQMASGIPEDEAQKVEFFGTGPQPQYPWNVKIGGGDEVIGTVTTTTTSVPPGSLTEYVSWTGSGENVTIELDDDKFKFMGDDSTYIYNATAIEDLPDDMED